MKSWRFYTTHQPLVLEEVPEPELQPGKVLIDVKAGGLCHSDVGLLEDEKWLASVPVRPMTPGHEIAGVITETVGRWDAAETSEKIELQVGKDLQFIRINGTVVGALAGLLIFAAAQAVVSLV